MKYGGHLQWTHLGSVMSKRDVSSTVQELRFTISCRNIEEIMLMEDDYAHLLSNMSYKMNGGYFVCGFFFPGEGKISE